RAPRTQCSPAGGGARALFPALLGGGRLARRRRVLAALLGREREVLLPLLAELLALLGALLGELAVVFARLLALLGREARPFLHALLDALLPLGRHLRIALGDADPAPARVRIEVLPLGLERRENFLLLDGELAPGGAGRLGLGGLGIRPEAERKR